MAADGYFTKGIEPQRTFPYGFHANNDRRMIVAPTGICDPTMADTRERLAPFRVSTGFFTGTMAGAGQSIIFPATSVQLFTAGPGDSAAAAGGGTGALARSDTNAQSVANGGGAVRANQAFVMTGLWFQFLRPYTVLAAADAVGTTRTGSAFLRSPVSPYDRVIQDLQGPVINPSLKNGKDSACEFDLFALDTWPQAGGMAPASIGIGGLGPSFLHLAVPEVSGGQGTGMELQVKLIQDRIVEIESDAANPTPGAAVKVISAVRCVAVGYPICATPGTAAIDYDQLARALIANGKGMSPNGSYDEQLLKEAIAKQSGRGY